MTSGGAAKEFAQNSEVRGAENPDAVRKSLTHELKKYLRPELLNRIDDIVLFRPLSEAALEMVADMLLREVSSMLAERRIRIEFSSEVRAEISKLGFDPEFGARPMRRAVTRFVVNPLSLKILSGEISEGDTVAISVQSDGMFAFKKIR